MNKFKVGDTVIILNILGAEASSDIGKEGIIVETNITPYTTFTVHTVRGASGELWDVIEFELKDCGSVRCTSFKRETRKLVI